MALPQLFIAKRVMSVLLLPYDTSVYEIGWKNASGNLHKKSYYFCGLSDCRLAAYLARMLS